ncbi:MAG: hypothetical protein RLZZ344_249 [Pseudomonadota bacterium]|jgi:predicted PurR-regulated permease PerM
MTEALAPFFAALLLAYLLEPLAGRFESLGVARSLASLAAIVVGLVLVVGLAAIAVPIINHEFVLLRERLPDALSAVYSQVYPWLLQLGLPVDDSAALRARLIEALRDQSGSVSTTLWSTLQSGLGLLVALVGWLVLVPVVIFFLLKDWLQILFRVLAFFPPRQRGVIQDTSREIHQTLKAYMQGQLLVMASMAAFYAVALWIGGLSSWFSIGLLSGLLVFIPYVGFALSVVIAGVSAILEIGLGQGLLVVVIAYGLGQILESFILTPKVVGDRIGLHPLAVLLALVVFGSLLGFVGVLLALPLAAVLVVLGRRMIRAWHDDSLGR